MLFHSFSSQSQRREYGGGDFMEIQYCRLKKGTEEIVSTHTVEHWKDDSLYIYGDDWNMFCDAYEKIITGGNCDNSNGCLDWCGINYFSSKQTAEIIKRIKEEKPPEYQTLLNWFEKEKQNGFYILGL